MQILKGGVSIKNGITICSTPVSFLTQPSSVVISEASRYEHTVILGPDDCGKTTKIMLPMVNQDLQDRRWGVAVLDCHGDLAVKASFLAGKYGRPVFLYDINRKDRPVIAPLSGQETVVAERMVSILKLLAPELSKKVWAPLSKVVFEIVSVLKRQDILEKQEGKYANLTVFNKLLNRDEEGREIFKRYLSLGTNEPIAPVGSVAGCLVDYLSDDSSLYGQCAILRERLGELLNDAEFRRTMCPEDGEKGRAVLNLSKLVGDNIAICFSGVSENSLSWTEVVITTFMYQLRDALFSRGFDKIDSNPWALYLDDIDRYINNSLPDFLQCGELCHVALISSAESRAKMLQECDTERWVTIEMLFSTTKNVLLFPGIPKEDRMFYLDEYTPFAGALSEEGMDDGSDKVVYILSVNGEFQEAKFGQPIALPDELTQYLSFELEKRAQQTQDKRTARQTECGHK